MITLFVDGQPVQSTSLLYIPQAATPLTSAGLLGGKHGDVVAFIGGGHATTTNHAHATPLQLPSPLPSPPRMTWSVGSCYLLDEPMTPLAANALFSAGPRYSGGFHGEDGRGRIPVCLTTLSPLNIATLFHGESQRLHRFHRQHHSNRRSGNGDKGRKSSSVSSSSSSSSSSASAPRLSSSLSLSGGDNASINSGSSRSSSKGGDRGSSSGSGGGGSSSGGGSGVGGGSSGGGGGGAGSDADLALIEWDTRTRNGTTHIVLPSPLLPNHIMVAVSAARVIEMRPTNIIATLGHDRVVASSQAFDQWQHLLRHHYQDHQDHDQHSGEGHGQSQTSAQPPPPPPPPPPRRTNSMGYVLDTVGRGATSDQQYRQDQQDQQHPPPPPPPPPGPPPQGSLPPGIHPPGNTQKGGEGGGGGEEARGETKFTGERSGNDAIVSSETSQETPQEASQEAQEKATPPSSPPSPRFATTQWVLLPGPGGCGPGGMRAPPGMMRCSQGRIQQPSRIADTIRGTCKGGTELLLLLLDLAHTEAAVVDVLTLMRAATCAHAKNLEVRRDHHVEVGLL